MAQGREHSQGPRVSRCRRPRSDRRFLGPKRPNVLLVTFDQWRADHLKRSGARCRTPNVDALAAGG